MWEVRIAGEIDNAAKLADRTSLKTELLASLPPPPPLSRSCGLPSDDLHIPLLSHQQQPSPVTVQALVSLAEAAGSGDGESGVSALLLQLLLLILEEADPLSCAPISLSCLFLC